MIVREMQDSVAVLRMEHGKVNAIDIELFSELQTELKYLESSEANAVILTGTGKSFSAGVDLFRLLRSGTDYVRSFVKILCEGLEILFFYPKPVVAAVNGHAVAGGYILTCACDYRIAAQTSLTIGVPELLVGVPFPAVALEIMRFAVAPQHLQHIAYTGRTYLPDDALQLGLIDEVAAPEKLMERAIQIASGFGLLPPDAFKMTKKTLREPVRQRLQMPPKESEEVMKAWCDPETHRIIRDYLDRTIGKRSS